jgi:putative ABC transport system substrate-binding protein
MKRRDFLALGVTLLGLPITLRAQSKVATIGYLSVDSVKPSPWLQVMLGALGDKGYINGRNLRIDDRTVLEGYGGLTENAAELVKSRVDLILAYGSTATRAAARATKKIPIVMVAGIDPVAAGLATTLAHPEGNVSGINTLASELQQKRIQLLKELIPELRRIGVLSASDAGAAAARLGESKAAADALNLTLHVAEVHTPNEIAGAFAALAQAKVQAVIVLPSRIFTSTSARVAALAAQHRLPAVYSIHEFVDVGGLMSYGVNLRNAFIKAASYVDRILKGATPGDLPIEQASEFELVINLRSANALGVKVPQSLLLLASRVIE